MVQKHIIISMIAPVALGGILILAVLTAIPSNNHAFAFGNSFTFASPTSSEESNSTGNAQESNNTGNVQQQSNSTGNAQESNNAGNVQQQSNSTGNAQESNNAGNAQESNNAGNVQQQSNSTGNAQESNNAGNAQADLANSILAVHNRERAAVGVPPLVWSDKLAADAKPWAEHLATLGEINQQNAHDPNLNGEGENVHLGNPAYRAITSAEEMLQGWVSEKNNYHGEPTGQALHYTQMVWRDTTAVGCAIASPSGNGKWDILVCRYSPPGNMIGQKPY
jgi:uncharacterized protein YkwD